MSDMRAKMTVTKVEPATGGEAETLHFSAVSKNEGYESDGLDENNTYALFTPSADINIHINNPVLVGKFNVGESYYIDFTQAPA